VYVCVCVCVCVCAVVGCGASLIPINSNSQTSNRSINKQQPTINPHQTPHAALGYMVAREVGPPSASEVRRQRVVEKVLDVAATSPFARLVRRWVLVGFGTGARVAAVVGARARSAIAGQVLFGYPLAVRRAASAWLGGRV